ncbi:GntR family transcriptional regulator [Intestinimonas aquisgranensis]|nr:GntR family transcriptional regulator [Intestinimonas aquisgranensis]
MQEYRPRPSARARELLEGLLADYRLRPGDRIPSERSLSEAWGLSRTTLRSAVALMEQDGRLLSRPGAGTFVAPEKYTRRLQGLLSMSQSAAEQGRKVTTRLLELRRTECDKHLARRFNQVLGYPLYKIVRLRSVDGEPLMVETSYIPAQRVAGLENKDLENHSLFSILEEDFGILPVQGEEEIGITYATAEEAELMGIESGSPLFWIVSMTYDQTGQLMEYCRGAARPDRLRITTVMECQEEEADSNEA